LGLGTLLGTFAKLTILRELIGNIAVVTTGSPGDCSSSPVTRETPSSLRRKTGGRTPLVPGCKSLALT